MVKSSSPPSFHKVRNNSKDKQQYDEKGWPVYKCEFCDKVFTTGQALGGHKTCHRSNKQQIHGDKAHKTIKITFFLSSSPSYPNNGDAKLKRHSPAALEPCQQEELPAVDLLSYLPPRLYNTKKRCRRYLIDHGVSNNAPPIPSLDMSRESVANLDLNRSEYKRMKISSNGNETEMMQKPFVPLTSDGIDETVGKEEKNLSEGETAESRVVRNFDLNELPTNDPEEE
ncbi:unnamed protein product [Lathyrus oleraceus]